MDFGKNICWMREIKAPCLLWDPLEPLHFLFKQGHETVSKLGWAEYSDPILTSGFSSSIVGLQLRPIVPLFLLGKRAGHVPCA